MIEKSSHKIVSHNAVEKFRKKDRKRLCIPLEGNPRFYLQQRLFACLLFFERGRRREREKKLKWVVMR